MENNFCFLTVFSVFLEKLVEGVVMLVMLVCLTCFELVWVEKRRRRACVHVPDALSWV